jgi:uncharacterized protein
MSKVTLMEIYEHPITQKYVRRSGMAHAISVAYHAYRLSEIHGVNPEIAVKAGLLHDIGHYTWYREGEWDYDSYKQNDIHPIKGAERAHKLLIRLGENPVVAKEISLAILFHTDSVLSKGQKMTLNTIQHVVHLADEADKQPNHLHHYREISREKEMSLIRELDRKLDRLNNESSILSRKLQ